MSETNRVFLIHLPEGNGTPVRRAHIDIPLSGGRLGSIDFPWPLTPIQHEALALQLDQHLEVIRRFFVTPKVSDVSSTETTEPEAGIVPVQAPGAGDCVAASGDRTPAAAATANATPNDSDVRDGGRGDAEGNEAAEVAERRAAASDTKVK